MQTPRLAPSTATVLARAMTAPLLAAYADAVGSPNRPAVDDTMRMRPWPAARMTRAAAEATSTVPSTFTSST